jgi:glutathione S-transferase
MSGYELAIGDRGYSSWSLRGWLLFDAFGLAVKTRQGRLYTDDFPRLMAEFAPARTAPALRLPSGVVIAESLAIAEELASRHPDAGLWPADPDTRAVARALAAEMHVGFSALRSHCPMNLRVSYTGCEPPQAVLDDLARLEQIWAWARATTGATGDWLCGDYSVADVFFAPVAARIAGYGLPVGGQASAYVAAHLAHPSFRRWRAMGMVDGADQAYYKRDYPTRPWPGPTPLPARAVAQGPSVNTACPYSGDPVTDFAEIEGRIWGFCNPFCRDKTVADALAWPKFTALLRQ